MRYHYGQTIREYRILKKMSLSQLAEKWPSKETGVTPRYVSDIERGVKHVGDVSVLRELATMLQIPLWKLGLSEYNPFQAIENNLGHTSTIQANFSLLDSFIKQIWVTKVTSGIDIDAHLLILSNHLKEMINTSSPSLFNNADFLCIYVQTKRLQAIRLYDRKQYGQALQLFFEMLEIAKRNNNPVSLTLAYMGIGVELMRDNKLQESISYLEKARDETFKTSKELASLVNGMLARVYATIGDVYQFEKYYAYAATLGRKLGNSRLNMQDYTFTSYSGILEEGSNGYILLENGKKALELLPTIKTQIAKEGNIYLDMWLPLDYAQAFLYEKEIEESIKYLRIYYEKTHLMRTPHISSTIEKHLFQLDELGYTNLSVVKDFKQMYLETEKRI